jgi:chromosome segregation ATPase
MTKTIEQEIADLKEEIQERDEVISQLKDDVLELKGEIRDLEKDIEQKNNEIEDLESKLEEKPSNTFRGIGEISWDAEQGNLADIQMMEALEEACEKGTTREITEHLNAFKPVNRYSVEDLL